MIYIRSLSVFFLFACLLLSSSCSVGGAQWQLQSGGTGSLPRPVRVLLAGDSLMASLGPQLRKELSGYTNLTLFPIGKSSSGLARPDFYDWPRVLEEHLRSDQPHIVVMWIGTNDSQRIYRMPQAGEPGSKSWLIAYYGKIAQIVNLSRRYHARFILMGPPAVAHSSRTDATLVIINDFMRRICRRYSIPYIDTRAALCDSHGHFCLQGRRASGERVDIRTPDRVHITADGNRIVMKHLLPILSRIIAGQSATPSRNSYSRGNRSISGSNQ